jgi:hypothetical protein
VDVGQNVDPTAIAVVSKSQNPATLAHQSRPWPALRHHLHPNATEQTAPKTHPAERESNFKFSKRGPIRCGLSAELRRDAA